MQRYTKLGFSIVVDIGVNDFIVRADILKHKEPESNTYTVSFQLGNKGYDFWHDIDKDSKHTPIVMVSENINMDVSHLIMARLKDGYFEPHIQTYNYFVWCLYEGDKVLREEED